MTEQNSTPEKSPQSDAATQDVSTANADVMEICVLRSKRRADTYLYMPSEDEYSQLPEALQKQFGDGEVFLTFELHAERKLAIANTEQVISAIQSQGFYLQMPVDPNKINQLIQK